MSDNASAVAFQREIGRNDNRKEKRPKKEAADHVVPDTGAYRFGGGSGYVASLRGGDAVRFRNADVDSGRARVFLVNGCTR